MSPPSAGKEESETAGSPNEKKKGWFTSLFENDNSNFKEQIHHELNEFDEYKRNYREPNPFFFPAGPGNPSTLQQEIEDFFESAGLGAFANPHLAASSSSVASRMMAGSYQMIRKENQNGVQLDIQFPSKVRQEQLAVEVLQESPCVVQWRNQGTESSFQDRTHFGEHIDCSKMSASLRDNLLTLQAPRHQMATGNQTPRKVPVTDHDS